jgi:hypothetical protein
MNEPLVALGLGALVWIGGAELHRFEKIAAADLRSRLECTASTQVSVRAQTNGLLGLFGELESVTIRASGFSTPGLPLFTEPRRSQAGRIGKLNLELSDFSIAGLHVERLTATIPGCRYDFGLALRHRQLRLSRSGVGVGTVTILEEDLARWILQKFHEIERVTVKIDRDRAWVEGFGRFLVATTEFAVIADLAIQEGSRLRLSDAKVYFDWLRVEPETRDVLLRTLNPIVDLDKDLGLYGAIVLEGVRLRDGRVTAWGSTRIPILPADN